MKLHGRRVGGGATESPGGTTAARGADFAWPPGPDDLQGCVIVRVAEDAGHPHLRVLVRLADVLSPVDAASRRPPRRSFSPAPTFGPRTRRWGVEQPDVAFPFRVDRDGPVRETSPSAETWRAVVAVAAGVSLAALSYVQFRGSRTDATALVTAVAKAAASPAEPLRAEPVGQLPQASPDDIRPEIPRKPAIAAPAEQPARARSAPPAARAIERQRPTLVQLAAEVLEEIRPTAPTATAVAAPRIDTSEPGSAGGTVEPTAPPVTPALDDGPPASTRLPVAAVRVDPVPGDEDHIRAALTRWRAAYSALDARAAREVWPSVDARALERAFRALKSQELRFDRCDLTVSGGSAQAACIGRAVYVPRVGNQSPRAAPREWTFELKKLDERWTIASARAS